MQKKTDLAVNLTIGVLTFLIGLILIFYILLSARVSSTFTYSLKELEDSPWKGWNLTLNHKARFYKSPFKSSL